VPQLLVDYDAFRLLLDDFLDVPSGGVSNPTIFEIAGYPHYENVCSNILAFFLKPDAVHGLKDLCLKSLLQLVGCQDGQSNVEVEREAATQAGNRIDLIVRSDTHLIGIENKVFHWVSNPFEDYARFLNQESKGRQVITILLGIEPVTNAETHGFRPIRYSEYFERLRSLIGTYLVGADTKYLGHLIDFMSTLENLMRGTAMNEDQFAFFHDRESDVVALLREVKKFKDELRSKLVSLADLLQIEGGAKPVKQWYYREGNALFDTLVHDIAVDSDFTVAIDCTISASGWEIKIFSRSGGKTDDLKSLLMNREIPFADGKRLTYPTRYDYSEELPTLQKVLQGIIDKIAERPAATKVER
jgi:hypothetical protein